MMTRANLVVGVLCLILAAPLRACPDTHFMECAGNEPGWWNVLRRCCHDDQLPNDCECYDISSDLTEFTNTAFFNPQCPVDIASTFNLYTRATASYGEIIRSTEAGLSGSAFDGAKMTYFITHGFTDSVQSGWAKRMKDALLAAGDVNVVLVDWRQGAKAPNYFQATANTRVIGSMIARLILDMNQYKAASYNNIHLIGHSLGAHLMGYAGKEIVHRTGQQLGRITGLDPAGPNFGEYSDCVHLGREDAAFVDIIHTDAEELLSSGFGIQVSIGDVDFYPNGGKHQPGCPEETYGIFSMISFGDEKETGACSHGRAIEVFINSISNCRWETRKSGKTCAMGYQVSADCRGSISPSTTGVAPFC